ncbi:hypothetical protein GCM10008902_21160 [[Clostridium] innocuum]
MFSLYISIRIEHAKLLNNFEIRKKLYFQETHGAAAAVKGRYTPGMYAFYYQHVPLYEVV